MNLIVEPKYYQFFNLEVPFYKISLDFETVDEIKHLLEVLTAFNGLVDKNGEYFKQARVFSEDLYNKLFPVFAYISHWMETKEKDQK